MLKDIFGENTFPKTNFMGDTQNSFNTRNSKRMFHTFEEGQKVYSQNNFSNRIKPATTVYSFLGKQHIDL